MARYYLYDGEHWIMEYDGVGAFKSNTLYGLGIDEIIARGSNAGQFYLPDRNGNTALVTGPLASNGYAPVTEQYRYDAFGAPTIMDVAGNVLQASLIGNRFLFTGREYNSQFGFYEYRARAYHPGLGRFMSEDPKGFDAGDYNFYRYCWNDPLDRTDPMGLTDIPEYTPELQKQIITASVNSYNAYKSGTDKHATSQLIVQRINSQGKPIGKPFLQTQKDGSPTINRSLIQSEGRVEAIRDHHGASNRYREIETGEAESGTRAVAGGHLHSDKTGHGMAKWSDTDNSTAVKNAIGRVDESNPAKEHILIPQQETNLAPREITVPTGLPPGSKGQ